MSITQQATGDTKVISFARNYIQCKKSPEIEKMAFKKFNIVITILENQEFEMVNYCIV